MQSFKQFAADQVRSEHRTFVLGQWLTELMTRLGTVLSKRGFCVRIDCPGDLTMASFPGSLGQVITNLVVNAAVRGCEPGSTGTLSMTLRPDGAGRLSLVVADDGKGTGPEVQARIFDPFFTTARQRGSTGLGLHIVSDLVVQTLKGRIGIDSAPGRGTRFTVTLAASVPPGES